MSVSTKPFGEPWVTEYFAMVDTLDPEEFVRWYSDDAALKVCNLPAAVGKAAIVTSLRQFYGSIATMRHEKTGLWMDADSAVFEAMAHYKMKDGREITIPAISSLRMKGALIERCMFVMDATALFPVSG